MRVTQGTFSFLPDLSDHQIERQIAYCLKKGWAVSIEHTDNPHPRNTYWEMWGLPMFDLGDPAAAMMQLRACRGANPNAYVRVNGFDSSRGWEAVRLSFIAQRPRTEPDLVLERIEGEGRTTRYQLRVAQAEQSGPVRNGNGKFPERRP